MRQKIMTLLFCWLTFTGFAQQNFNIITYGAKIGAKNNALSIQKAIDLASKRGGKVIVPAGNFVTGPLLLKSNVELHLEANAVLLGSADRLDYSPGKLSVISAYNQQHISITGTGTIDGQAHMLMLNMFQLLRDGKIKDELWLAKRPHEDNRPNLVYIKGCKNVKVTGITLKDAASWVQNYKECDGVIIDNMKVYSTTYWNNDGIDIVDSKNVKITNSYFNAADDAICLKSEITNGSCENVWIENCTARSSASGFKIGTGSLGGFKNITVKNLMVYDTYRSAIAIETVDGGFLENINVSGVRAKNTGNAIFIRLGHRNTDNRYSSIKNVLISDVIAEIPNSKPDLGYPLEGPPPKVLPHNLVPASITGLPGHLVENITLKNIDIIYGGGASKEKAFASIDELGKITENTAGYPEFNMFGELPSWGLYVRHAKGITLDQVKIILKQQDFRPAMVFDNVIGLDLKSVSVPKDAVLPVLVYKDVEKLSTTDLMIPAGSDATVVKK